LGGIISGEVKKHQPVPVLLSNVNGFGSGRSDLLAPTRSKPKLRD
jgi:hypothetical protein